MRAHKERTRRFGPKSDSEIRNALIEKSPKKENALNQTGRKESNSCSVISTRK